MKDENLPISFFIDYIEKTFCVTPVRISPETARRLDPFHDPVVVLINNEDEFPRSLSGRYSDRPLGRYPRLISCHNNLGIPLQNKGDYRAWNPNSSVVASDIKSCRKVYYVANIDTETIDISEFI